MATKRLAFVDDDLDNFHANTYLKEIRGRLAARGWEVAAATALRAEKGRAWAEANGVRYVADAAALAGVVDAVAVLAPSSPETHERLCEAVFPLRLPTFVDKTFAPDAPSAERLFALADASGTPVQTTSALRTTNLQREVAELDEPLVSLSAWAGGASWDEYGVHPVELVVSCMGPGVKRLTVTGSEIHPTVVLSFDGDRTATIDFNAGEWTPFLAAATTRLATRWFPVEDQTLFLDAAAAILDFFDAGAALVPRAETMAVMRVLDAARRPEARRGWVEL